VESSICKTVRYCVPLHSIFGAKIMQTLSASSVRTNLYRLIDEAATTHEPLVITGKRNNAVLVSLEDWSAIQETMFLLSIPNMRESIKEGFATPAKDLVNNLDW
jgi:prevent-host-death family protein